MNPKPTTMDDLEQYAKIYKCLICEPSDSSDHSFEPKSTSSTKCPNCKSDLKSYEPLCLYADHNPEVELDQQLSTQLNNNDTNNTEFRETENYGDPDQDFVLIKQSTSELAKSEILSQKSSQESVVPITIGEDHIEKLEKEYEKLQNEFRIIKDCHDCQINGPFSKEFKVLKEPKDLVDKKIKKLIAKLNSFKLNYPKAQEQIRQLTKENKQLSEQNESFKCKNQDLNSAVEKVKKLHDIACNTNLKLVESNIQLEERLKSKIKELEEKQEAYRESVDQQNAQLNSQFNELTEQKNENERLATELDQTKSQYNEIERKFRDKNAEFEELYVLYEDQKKAQIIELDNIAKQKKYLETNNQQLTKEKDELEEKYQQLEFDMDELICENSDIKNQNGRLKIEVEDKQVTIENLTKQKQQLELDRDRVHKSIRQTMTNFESVRQNFDELNGFID